MGDDLGPWFARLTKKCGIRDKDALRIWEEDRVAIHYPGSGPEDSTSLDPGDYDSLGATRGIKALRRLSKKGGYVWIQTRVSDTVKVGKVQPGTSIELVEGEWGSRYEGREGRKAILKTLPLKGTKELGPAERLDLRVARPRSSTICRWKKAGDRLRAIVEGEEVPATWSNLSVGEQEVVCSEFLRAPQSPEIPQLGHLLLPPGRTLKDVDIYGLADDGHRLFAQVTFTGRRSKKEDALRRYQGDGAHLVFFCRCDGVIRDDGITFVPTDRVLEWAETRPDLHAALFEK